MCPANCPNVCREHICSLTTKFPVFALHGFPALTCSLFGSHPSLLSHCHRLGCPPSSCLQKRISVALGLLDFPVSGEREKGREEGRRGRDEEEGERGGIAGKEGRGGGQEMKGNGRERQMGGEGGRGG